ncbi:endonuclease III [Caviibacter abscessus]|uniref:endonuclease III n=1 Tax=Caviibacter abscessus TaxID=1766719 RepID=UPI00082CD696|nr:endonuclease III [Caviibacter abscessus]
MTKKEKIKYVLTFFENKYGNLKTELNYETEFQLMIAVILSAQCTDARVNIVTKELFKIVKFPIDIVNMDIKTLETYIKSTGFYHNKAKNIKENSKLLYEKYNSILPHNMEELLKLPGVGRKTANVLLHELWNINEGIVVDTHVIRLVNLLKIVNTKNPVIIENELKKLVPKKYWRNITHYFILHGREKCIQRKLECEVCDLIRK